MSGTITPCQVATLLRHNGVAEQYINRLVCTAKYESGFRCGAQNLANSDGSGDYGLFQCNSQYWCSGGRGRNRGNGTGRTCQQLLQCNEGARCASIVIKQQGITAWYAYRSHKSECDSYRVPDCSTSPPSGGAVTPPQNSAPTCNVGSRRGACIDVSDCNGNRESVAGHCPGAANIRCCVTKTSPTPSPTPRPSPSPQPSGSPINVQPSNGCDMITPVCSNLIPGYCGSSTFAIDREFLPFVTEYNKCAAQAGTKLGICSSYRNIAHNAAVGGATSSNHLVGHAIDMNIIDKNGRNCDWNCMLSSSARASHPGVQATIDCFNRLPSPSRYGGNPRFGIVSAGKTDAVHLDDGLNSRDPSRHRAKINACNADTNFERVNCGATGPIPPPPPPPPCIAHGKKGVCKETSKCATQSFSYQANVVTGCKELPANVRCCINANQVDPPRPTPKPPTPSPPAPKPTPKPVPAPAGAKDCNVNGVSGKCIATSACNGVSTRGFCPGTPDNIRCCTPRGATPPPSMPGNGWLTTAGSFTIIRDDCSGRASFGGFDIPVNKFVLHTVEGGAGKCGIDGATSVLKSNTYFPHFIIGRDCNNHVRIKQLIPTTVSGRALKSPGNRLGALQVEICGYASKPFTRDDPGTTEAVRSLFQELRRRYPAIPNHNPKPFAGNNAYGIHGAVRVSESFYRSNGGLYGHQHVPSNDHWDPGAIDPRPILCEKPGCGSPVPFNVIDEVLLESKPEPEAVFDGYDITEDEFKCAFPPKNGVPADNLVKIFVDKINNAMTEFHISLSYEATTSFLAELAYETDGFTTLQHRDASDCSSYVGGCTYTRRSLGAKGRDVYEQLSAMLGLNLMDSPDLASVPQYAFRIAGAIWKSKALSEAANATNYEEVTKLVSDCRDCTDRLAAVNAIRDRVKGCVHKLGYEDTSATTPPLCFVLNYDDAVNSGKHGVCMPADQCGGNILQDPTDYDAGDEMAIVKNVTLQPVEALSNPSVIDAMKQTLDAVDAIFVANDADEMSEMMMSMMSTMSMDPITTSGWISPKSLWRYALMPNSTTNDDNETIAITDWTPYEADVFGVASFDASAWRVGRAPFGFGDEARGIEYTTNLAGFEDSMRFRLTFMLTTEDMLELSAENTVLRLSVASDDSARVVLNGKVVLAGNSTMRREAEHYNDVVELSSSAVNVGMNVIGVMVYNQDPSTDAFFDLELMPRPKLSVDELAEANHAASPTCKEGHRDCPCIVTPDMDDPSIEKSLCLDGLSCDTYNNVCILDWDAKWNPDEADINNGHETIENNRHTHTTVAGFCRSADHVCCVVADHATPERYSEHDEDDDDDPLTGPLDEMTNQRDMRDPAQFKPYVAAGQEAIMTPDGGSGSAASSLVASIVVALVAAFVATL